MASAESISHHFPIGKAPIDAYQRSFLIDARGKVEVTSVDISNHGMFLVVGCSNGAVLLYNLTKRVQSGEGIYLGQINCKGLHSVMSMKVKISDDCRFCFAGVIRGSNELLAIDLSHLQWEWNEFDSLPMPTGKGKKQSAIVTGKSSVDLFETFVLADAKLKGFGACCSKFTDTTVSENGVLGHQYLLASGLGIKNVHVWELTVYDEPVALEGSISPAKRDHWKCIYDVATNGNTITHLGFRNFGKELISKSGTFNIRVWDISKYKDEPNSKPPYEDIGNSQDVKCLLETSDFSYGGIYDFSMVKVDKNIPKEANRNSFELPDKALPESQYEESVRRRRTMREVVDVVGTQDGEHVLIKVADGGVLHFHHPKTTHIRCTTPIGKFPLMSHNLYEFH
jgi:WD40 repeat protein